jgi:antitoxin (DNA-binding transcriptional repressor) of toxin-antitoxin stability system
MRPAKTASPLLRVGDDDPLIYTMRALSQRTAQVMGNIEMIGKPAFITRHGRFVAVITPLAPGQVESQVLPEMARELGQWEGDDIRRPGGR